MRRSTFINSLLGLAAVFAVGAVQAQAWPTKPVRFVLGAPAGTAPDIAARIVGERLTALWGQQVLIDNRPGGGGMIAMEHVKASPADGLTLMFTHAGAALITPRMLKGAKYDPVADFVTLGFVADSPMVVVASNSLKEKTLAEVLKAAREQPGKWSIGSTEQATLPYLVVAALAQSVGATVVQVPFNRPNQGIQGLISGEVPVYVDGVGPLLPLIREGKIRALAVTSDKPLPGLDGIPLVKDTVPGYSAVGWFALQAPKGLGVDIAARINRDLNQVLTQPDVASRLQDMVLFASPRSLEESASFVKSEVARWATVIQSANLQPQ